MSEWTGTEGDRQLVMGRLVSYALSGSAEELIARLQRIIASHPDLDPRDIMCTCMVHVAPGLAEVWDRQRASRDD